MRKVIIFAMTRRQDDLNLRLGHPFCLTNIDGKTLIVECARIFEASRYAIVCNDHEDMLRNYLQVFFPYPFELLKVNDDNFSALTARSVTAALRVLKQGADDSLILVDAGILYTQKINLDEKGNFVGIAQGIWRESSLDGKSFLHVPSRTDGLSGLFLFEKQASLNFLGDRRYAKLTFTDALMKKGIAFKRLDIFGCIDQGGALSFRDLGVAASEDPLEDCTFKTGSLLMRKSSELHKKSLEYECSWYEKAAALGFEFLPLIHSTRPLKLELPDLRLLADYTFLSHDVKSLIVKKWIGAVDRLHQLSLTSGNGTKFVSSVYERYFDRAKPLSKAIPFACDNLLNINGGVCRNVFQLRQTALSLLLEMSDDKFSLLHGRLNLDNMRFDPKKNRVVLINPHDFGGPNGCYGDPTLDIASLSLSLCMGFEQFKRREYEMHFSSKGVKFKLGRNALGLDCRSFFKLLPNISPLKIKILQALLWLDTAFAFKGDFDGMCLAFYQGTVILNQALDEESSHLTKKR